MQRLLEGQDEVLAGVASGSPSGPLVDSIARLVEECVPGTLCSVLLVDRESGTLRHAAAPSLPHAYVAAIDGAAIGPAAGPCGTAALTGEPVFVRDVATDPICPDRRDAAAAAGLAACWSVPVKVGDEVVAVVAAYSRDPRDATDADRVLMERCAALLAVVLRREADLRHRAAVEGRYRMLIEEMPVVAYESATDGSIRLFVSPQIEPVLGFTSQQVVSGEATKAWREMLHPDDRDAVAEDWEHARVEGRTWDREYRMVRPDGETVWVRNVDMVVRDEHGRPTGRQGVVFDVTSRVDTVNALRDAEHRWRTLVERLPAVTYIDGLDHEPSYASPQIQQLVGMTPEQWLERWEECIHPDDRDRVVANYHDHVRSGEAFEIEFRVLHPDGGVRWVSDRAAPVQSVAGGRTLFQGLLFDVTAQKVAENAVRESERRFREMLETVQLIAVITEIDGSVSFCNDHFVSLSGYRADEVLGRNWEELFVPEADRDDRTFFRELSEGRVVQHEITRMWTRAGEVRTISWSSTPLRDATGRVVAAASIGEDVTDRLRAEQALRESEERRRLVMAEMLRTAEEERTRIATELHDDTVQIMTATLMSLDRLTKAIERGTDEHVTASIATARSTLAAAVERTRRLMFELRPPLLESQGLDPALRDLAATAAAEVGFEVSASIEVGRYPEAVETLAYRTAQEAIANARKHAGARRLGLTLVEDAGQLRGEVRDDGRGFDVLQALDRRANRMHMGLDTMIERVRMAGGEIAVESAEGDGTTVRFCIPAA
jgi:PAS domain S-box-containing protein